MITQKTVYKIHSLNHCIFAIWFYKLWHVPCLLSQMTIAVIKEGVRVNEKYFFGQSLTFMMVLMMMMMMMREYIWQSAWVASSIPTMLEYFFTSHHPPCKRFLINIIFASIVFIIKMVNVRNAYPKIAY